MSKLQLNYRRLVEDVYNNVRKSCEDQILNFFEEHEKHQPVILGIEYAGHPNPYADAINMRLRVLGITNTLYYPYKSGEEISEINYKGGNVLIIDLHAAPEKVVKKYMERIKNNGANEVRYLSPVPKPIFYSLEDLKEI